MGVMARCQEASVQVHPESGWYQDNLKAPPSTCRDLVVDETLLQQSLNAIAAAAAAAAATATATATEDVIVEEEKLPSMEEALPVHVLSDIINRVEDARDLANCMATSKSMKDAVSQVRTLTLVCKKRYYELARERYPVRPPCSYSDSDSDSEEGEEEEEHSEEEIEQENEQEEEEETESEHEEDSEEDDDEDCCEMSRAISMSMSTENSSCCGKYSPRPVHVSFKNACLNMLRHVEKVEELRIEVDQEMQANHLVKEEIHMVDFWLSEPMFVRKWVMGCCRSLRHLTVIDYGQQAIMRQSPIVRTLSENCHHLQSLELRNMYLDTTDLHQMPTLRTLTLRCIKMTDHSLTDINTAMPNLLTLALVSVFGVQEARLSSRNLEVLCLGLSTSAKTVDLHLPAVKKLQLKMTCPDSLRVKAPNLTYVAVCMENRENAVVEFENVNSLRELLFGASHFTTLSKLLRTNPLLEKIFLDVPCMALGEDGKWEGVLPQVLLRVPDMDSLKESCPVLNTLSVGPGLWHSFEESFIANKELATFRRWPALSRLIVHMVVMSLETCVSLLQWLVKAIPSLEFLELYVHSDSPVTVECLRHGFREMHPGLHGKMEWGVWRRSLNFQCFSF